MADEPLIPRPGMTVEDEYRSLSEENHALEERYDRLAAEYEKLADFAQDRGDFTIYRSEYEQLLQERDELESLKRVHDCHMAFYNLTVEQRDKAWREVEDLRSTIADALSALGTGKCDVPNCEGCKADAECARMILRGEEFDWKEGTHD